MLLGPARPEMIRMTKSPPVNEEAVEWGQLEKEVATQ